MKQLSSEEKHILGPFLGQPDDDYLYHSDSGATLYSSDDGSVAEKELDGDTERPRV